MSRLKKLAHNCEVWLLTIAWIVAADRRVRAAVLLGFALAVAGTLIHLARS
ncbi:hypothetical protein D9M69_472500 [compost metagenome]